MCHDFITFLILALSAKELSADLTYFCLEGKKITILDTSFLISSQRDHSTDF
jgi:hypothetical protein